MANQRAAIGHSPLPLARNFLFAIGLAGMAVLCRAALQPIAPATGPYLLLFPAIVFAGMLWGTWPTTVAALAGWIATSAIILNQSLYSPGMSRAAQLNTVLFVPSCAAVIWVTHKLRRSVASAERAEARLAEVFRQVPGAAAILEAPDGRLLLNSQRSGDILGHSPLGDMSVYGGLRPDGSRLPPEAYPIIRALRAGEVVGGEHIRYQRPDGRVVDLDVHAGPVRGANGQIVAAVGMAFDVTERMAAEKRLHQSEAEYRTVAERLRAAIDAGGFGVWEIDLATGYMRMDGTMAAMLGMKPEAVELEGMGMRPFIHPADYDSVSATMQAAVAAGGAYAEECRMLTAQGDVRWVISRGAVIKDMQKVIGVISDVTERRQREDALHAALEARDVLMREADHRIKNSLQLVASLLSIQVSKADDVAIKQALGDASARVQAIANAHLALERSPDLRMIEIDQMLADLCERVGTLNPAVEILFDGRSGLSLDAEKAIPLALIASEVLTNALRHAFAPGQPGQVSLATVQDESGLRVVIADAGRGLPTAARRGLGSSVIATLSRQIGARVSAESSPGTGTVVTTRLPFAPVEDAAASPRSPALATPA